MATVLIADNSPFSREIIKDCVEGGGLQPQCVETARELVKSVYEVKPQIIVIARNLPDLSAMRCAGFLKSKRGVKELPIIIVYNEGKSPDISLENIYRAVEIGVEKKDELIETLKSLSAENETDTYNKAIADIEKDKEGINDEVISNEIFAYLEEELVIDHLLNRAGDICFQYMSEQRTMIEKGLEFMDDFFSFDVAVIILPQRKRLKAYIHCGEETLRSDIDAFMKVALHDFYDNFEGYNLEDVEEVLFNIDNRDDFEKLRIDNKKMSAYYYQPLIDSNGEAFATIHAGQFINNYWTDKIRYRLSRSFDYLGVAIYNSEIYREEHDNRARLHKVFKKFVPEEIIQGLVEKESDAELMIGEKRNIVVLFSDIRSFTTISESNKPEDVIGFLNDYFDRQVGIIKKHGGNIDKFIGDAIFAIFGAPVSYEDNARRALISALEMIDELENINTAHMNIPDGKVKIGIGLHEGDAIVGNVGSSEKFDYTAIGDTVNLAARFEGYTKYYKRQILMSKTVADKVKDSFPVREIDKVKVKGKDTATGIYSYESDRNIMESGYLNKYYQAYKMYKLGNFITAAQYFHELKEENPNDAVIDIFIQRLKEFGETCPEGWDGSLKLSFK